MFDTDLKKGFNLFLSWPYLQTNMVSHYINGYIQLDHRCIFSLQIYINSLEGFKNLLISIFDMGLDLFNCPCAGFHY